VVGPKPGGMRRAHSSAPSARPTHRRSPRAIRETLMKTTRDVQLRWPLGQVFAVPLLSTLSSTSMTFSSSRAHAISVSTTRRTPSSSSTTR
jgi:hypothetical protein